MSGRWGRRRVVVGSVVGLWIVAVTGLGLWSVGNDPATVPEQRNIEQALPELQRAVAVTLGAASGPDRAVVLGDLRFAEDCDVTPVRGGVVATREVAVYLPEGEARPALEEIADALPAEYRALVSGGRGGTRFGLHADAGEFIAIDASADAGSKILTIRLDTDCRPFGDRRPAAPEESGAAPAELAGVLGALGSAELPVTSRTVACPDGPVAGTWTASGVAAPADFAERLARWAVEAETVRADISAYAYRAGERSVVVVPDDRGRLRVDVTTVC